MEKYANNLIAERAPEGEHMAEIREALTGARSMAEEVQALADKLFGPTPTVGSVGPNSGAGIISGVLPEMASQARATLTALEAAFSALHRIHDQL